MASTGFQSDAAAMTQAIRGFEESASSVSQTMRSLEGDLTSILSTYSGAQAQAFWQLHTRLQQDMTAASRELDTMSNLVNASRANYNTGDETVASTLGGLGGGLGGSVLGRLSGS